MTMGMRRQIDRYAIDGRQEVRAMVQIEAAQKVLVGFAIARVLGHDQSRNPLQHIGRAQHRPGLDARCIDKSARRGICFGVGQRCAAGGGHTHRCQGGLGRVWCHRLSKHARFATPERDEGEHGIERPSRHG